MMNIKSVKTKAGYDIALASVENLLDAKSGRPEGDELDVLVTLIEKYEALHYPIDASNPIEAMRFCIDQYDL